MRTARRRTNNGHDLSKDWLKIKTAFSDTAGDIKGKAASTFTQYADDVKSTSKKIHNKTVNYTAKKPLKSLGIAMAVGIAVGYLLKR